MNCIHNIVNIINNIYNFKFDSINLPKKVTIVNKVTEKNANHLFIIFNSIGVGWVFIFLIKLENPNFPVFLLLPLPYCIYMLLL